MVLVDTSVWVRALYGREPYASQLERLLADEKVAGHDLVYGELLVGDLGGRAPLLAKYERFRQAAMLPHSEVVALARSKRLHGRGAGWIDIHLLASAVAERIPFWTTDPRLAVLASELKVAYSPGL